MDYPTLTAILIGGVGAVLAFTWGLVLGWRMGGGVAPIPLPPSKNKTTAEDAPPVLRNPMPWISKDTRHGKTE